MVDSKTFDSAVDDQRNLTVNFVLTGFVVVFLLTSLITLGSYYLLRAYHLQFSSVQTFNTLQQMVFPKLAADSLVKSAENTERVAAAFTLATQSDAIVLIDKSGKRVWQSKASSDVNLGEFKKPISHLIPLPLFQHQDVYTFDQSFLKLETWLNIVQGDYPLFTQQVGVLDRSGKRIGVARLLVDVSSALSKALMLSLTLFVLLILSGLLLFRFLYNSFKRVLFKIERQEEKLNENVQYLSSLLSENKQMQSNIKTASARAVELNEQFLRRVGADLHDGPAQMIGYANLRLDKIAKMEVSKQFGHEFDGIRKALEESLDEIRGISSGLVLPELESMTLEECMRKVVIIHGGQSQAKIKQDYLDVPNDVPLPIKICAYRFIQEGLNNAEQHGGAEKCRLHTRYSNGVLQISLKDNGIGFKMSTLNNESNSVHLGLVGLKDRIESIGGAFHINSELGVGTAIRFTIAL